MSPADIPPPEARSRSIPRSAADVILDTLADSGVDYFLANGGTDFPPMVEAYSRAAAEGRKVPLPMVITHENTAVAMAHGYYLMTGRIQAVMVHVNVGTANTVNALLDARRDHVPLLLMAGLTPISETGPLGTRSQHIHWAQEMFDQAGIVREAVKWHYELRLPQMASDAVTRALEIASASPKGPVYLTLPRDILAQEVPATGAAVADAAAAPARRRVPAPPVSDQPSLEAAARLLAGAQAPLIITASAGRSAEGFAALAAFAERHAVPVVSFHPRYCNISSDHPMNFGYLSGHHTEKADVILVLDCDVPWIPSLDRLQPGVKVIHVAEDPNFQGYPMRSFPMDLAIRAETAGFLTALDAALGATEDPARVEARRAALAPEWQAMRARWAALSAEPAPGQPLNNEYVSRILGEVAGEDSIIVNEYSLRPAMCRRTQAQSYFGLSPSGGLGWGLGAALGIKLARPEKLVIAALGDGAYVFANPTASHWVSAAHDLPVLTVVFNNSLYGAVRNSTLAMYPQGWAAAAGARALADLSPAPAFEQVVAASGGLGLRVETAAELEPALRAAIHAVTVEKRQALVNVILG